MCAFKNVCDCVYTIYKREKCHLPGSCKDSSTEHARLSVNQELQLNSYLLKFK